MAGYFGCDLTSEAVDNIGTARTAAQKAKAYFLAKKSALETERDQALQELGVLKSELAALQKKYKEQCTCNMGPWGRPHRPELVPSQDLAELTLPEPRNSCWGTRIRN